MRGTILTAFIYKTWSHLSQEKEVYLLLRRTRLCMVWKNLLSWEVDRSVFSSALPNADLVLEGCCMHIHFIIHTQLQVSHLATSMSVRVIHCALTFVLAAILWTDL